jgi:ADP-ribose pyrophosphatase YjhB (NUDIX family)
MENQWLAYAKQLFSIAESGLAFCKDEFDIERFQEISVIARSMMADLAGTKIQYLPDLIQRPNSLYVTPQIEVRGAVFRDNKILLVQEKTDRKWSLPGGYADVGLSAKQNVEKEIIEEAGISVQAEHLFAVRHKAKGNYDADIRDFYKLYFICSEQSIEPICIGHETIDVKFFSVENLPPLSTGRVIQRDIQHAFDAVNSNQKTTLFD